MDFLFHFKSTYFVFPRIQMAEKFVKAVAKPSRPDMNPIRYSLN